MKAASGPAATPPPRWGKGAKAASACDRGNYLA